MADPTSTTSNRYEWIGSSGGLWGSAANWKDSTAGTSPARFVPGASNPVTINEPTGASYEVVSGGGSVASLSLTGAVALNGQYTSDSLVLGVDPPPNVPPPNYNYPPSSKLSLGSGSALSTGGVSVKNSTITVSGPGARLTAVAAMTLGGLANYNRAGVYRETGNLSVTDGASLGAAAVNVVSGSISVSGAGSRATFGGALTLGDAGAPAGSTLNYVSSSGSLAVDAGASFTTQGVMSLLYGSSASVEGTGSKLTVGGLSGTGQVQIGEEATLALNGAAAAGTTIAFAGHGATLSIGNASTLPYSIAATLTGLVGGDDIDLATNITSAAYNSTGTGTGTLNLFNGTQQVTSFTLSGSYAGYNFLVRPTASGSTVTLLQNGDGNPVVSSPTLTVAENAASTALGVAAPTDPNYGTGQLAITAVGLPNDGTVTLADGTTAVTAGQALTSAQLTSLRFKPTPGLFNTSSVFTYKVSDPAGNASTGTATLAIGPAVGNPVVSSPTLTVAENAAGTALNIAAPTDPNYDIGQLAITATTLPSDGTVTLADGATAVVAGQALTSAQLTGLQFKPTPGLFNASSTFAYTVSDPAGNASTGTATLAIGPAVGNPVVSSPTLTVAMNAVSTALGIAAPTDPNYAAGQLAITAASLPNDGVVTLADGTAVAAGQALTSNQLTGLRFTATPGLFNASSSFAYTASDPAGNASTGTATLAIGLPPTPKAEFDAAYYLQNNPDVAAAKVDPLKHFEAYGWKEGRNPDAIFNTQYYLNQNPDVAAAKVNPLTHYEIHGWKEGRDPSVNFGTAAYLKANPDVAGAHIDLLMHYIDYGSREGRMLFAAQPHGTGAQNPLVDNAYYFSKYSDVSVSGVNPFTHYDTVGWRQGRNPDALFDTNYYLQRNPDVKAAAIDPLLHYEQYGWKEGRDPSAQFSTSKYLAANADVKAAGANPLIHYEQYGIQEGRPIFHV